MRCPFCKELEDKVVDSRMSEDGSAIRRRRECLSCGRRFTTVEVVKELRLRVVKKDGSREPFERGKIMEGLIAACYKRPVAVEKLEAITAQVERQVLQKFDREVESRYIGELAMRRLREVDNVAYVRFASVYRAFNDAGEFFDALKPLLESSDPDEPTSDEGDGKGTGVIIPGDSKNEGREGTQ
ncbi:MAG: transcriptional repressor NrdR [Planctomycetes bacterium]|nr:transcriptional repressor NrdR [Planctomycetota bacterium]